MQTRPDAVVRRVSVLVASAFRRKVVVIVAACVLLNAAANAQQRGAGPGGPPAAAKTAAPVDITGYWVSIVTEDWIERMSPDSPPSGTGGGGGGFGGGGGGRGRGAAPQAPPANADPCRAYGAGGSMRVPGRLNITWADDNTLKIDMDAGTQTRLLRFGQSPAPAQRTLQGHSVATWDTGAAGRGGGFGGGGGRGAAAPAAPRWGQLRVVTTNTTGGYLLSSRNSYSENAVITEYFIPHSDFGAQYLTVVTSIEDGGGNPRIVSSTFKKEPDGSKFKPTGCEVVR
jgi:hypothetical protein